MPPGAKRVSFCFPSRALRGVGVVTDTEPTGGEASALLLGATGSGAAAAEALQYEAAEDSCHLTFRTALVKLTGMKLAGIGFATALTAASGVAGVDGTRSCALSASVCLVASYFYYLIWQVRRQGWEGGPFQLALLRPKKGGSEATGTVPQKLFVQEQAVDGLRQTDWTVTLVLMAIETDTLIRKLAPTRDSPYFSMLVSAVLQPLIVQVGTIPRFYMNNLRGWRNKDGEEVASSWFPQRIVGGLCFVAACVAFGFTTYNTLEHIGPLDEATYPDATDRAEAEALVVLAWSQLAYPIVAVVDFLWMLASRKQFAYNEYSANLSAFKDVVYATADVTTKAGMCLVAFLIATR
jgi:hypothetical protein